MYGVPGWIDTRGSVVVTMYVTTLGGTSVDVRPVGTAAPASRSAAPSLSSAGLEALSYRTPGNAAYQSTLTSLNAGENETFHLDPSDFMPFIGLELDNISGAVVVTATVYLA